MTLVEFLTARLDEDEAANAHGALWNADEDYAAALTARMRREVEAKRAIVAAVSEVGLARLLVSDVVLHHLAAVYADHPDYRGEWKSGGSLPPAGMQVPYRST